ncbi:MULTISPECIES: hypothetical protein [Enterococcus]|uniref:DUF1433 domain-containing protein n=1 Tax=Enterococcus mundtii TaxID=53346 RepID=A0AAI8WCY1_ENTMU|nr:hypothetical protein [Enterococcus mundtii]EOH63774.1 hypothetical protein UAC_01038 [Enterococcus mundtii ATCC 882]EOU13245.1 hypothetical protein I587_01795 [Enterococcus mundtii ATCC 882]MBE9909710.1 hypothetical protein [Enterococcus mundtii]MCA6772950.1 hypothetical protein [Enterococcus mundtii]QCJ56937.1 hypothetical protein DDJ96_10065 [Enterococcus mundtii]
MRKKEKIIVVSLTIVLVLLGTLGVKKIMEPTEKEKQIAFLKEHEEELTKYIIKRNSKANINIVKYNWESFRIEDSGAFTKKMYIVDIELYGIDNNEIDAGAIQVLPNNLQKPTKIEEIATNNFEEALEEFK